MGEWNTTKASVPNIEVAFLNAANAVILNSTSASKGLVSDNTQSKIMNFAAPVGAAVA